MAGTIARWGLWLASAIFLVFGVASFLAPGWASGSFPWRVGPFLAMTVGAWSIGVAGFAADAAHDLRPLRTYPILVFLGSFAVGQLAVVMVFVDRLQTGAILTWPYLLGLTVLLVATIATIVSWRHVARAEILGTGSGSVPGLARVVVALFALAVGGLALAAMIAGPEGIAAQGRFYPEPMGLFSIRAFAAFFIALAASTAALVPAGSLVPYLALARAGLYLIVPITLTAVVNLGLFDVAVRPASWIYFGAYLATAIGLLAVVWWERRHPEAARA